MNAVWINNVLNVLLVSRRIHIPVSWKSFDYFHNKWKQNSQFSEFLCAGRFICILRLFQFLFICASRVLNWSECYFLQKIEYFLMSGNLLERLTARSRSIAEALAREGGQLHRDSIISCEDRTRKKAKRIGTVPVLSKPRPKLFGEYEERLRRANLGANPLVVLLGN